MSEKLSENIYYRYIYYFDHRYINNFLLKGRKRNMVVVTRFDCLIRPYQAISVKSFSFFVSRKISSFFCYRAYGSQSRATLTFKVKSQRTATLKVNLISDYRAHFLCRQSQNVKKHSLFESNKTDRLFL